MHRVGAWGSAARPVTRAVARVEVLVGEQKPAEGSRLVRYNDGNDSQFDLLVTLPDNIGTKVDLRVTLSETIKTTEPQLTWRRHTARQWPTRLDGQA